MSPAGKRLLAERSRLRERLGGTGLDYVRALSATIDATLVELWSEAPEEGVAVVAVGGYGRGAMSPQSDVDLLILHRSRARPEAVTKRLLYELWDAGLEVGHATRTVKQCLRLAGERFDAEMALLDARLVAGDGELFEELRAGALAKTRKRGRRFLDDMIAGVRARYAAHGEGPYLLEPNLKEGAGGLRDLQVCRWLALLYPEGVFSHPAEEHEDFLHRVRNWLHDHTARRSDVLLLPYQDEAAHALGYPGPVGGDALMRDLYRVQRSVWWAARSALGWAGAPDGVDSSSDRRRDSRSRRVEGAPPARPADAAAALRVLAASGEDGVPLAAQTSEEIAGLQDPQWTLETRRAFFDLLRGGRLEALLEAEELGLLSKLLPEWDAVRWLPQRNAYHRFSVDVHCLAAVSEMASLGRRTGELVSQVWPSLANPNRALLAALLHDLGKGTGRPADPLVPTTAASHADRGAVAARSAALRMGLGDAAEEIVWLVANHLLLAETATRRDIGDQRLVESLGARIGGVERLKALYALTVADALATGPEAWTPWKAALVGDLFSKVLHVLERREVVGFDVDAVLARKRGELLEALERRRPGVADAHLAGMTRQYALMFSTPALVRHASMMASSPQAGEARVHAVPSGDPGVEEITVVAADRPGLFATISGVLSLCGLNIVGAEVFTRADGVALEVFRALDAFGRPFSPERAEQIRDLAVRALCDEIDLEAEIAARRALYGTGARLEPVVVIDNEVSDFATVVEVHAGDHVGLLHDLTRALAEARLDIRAARIVTQGDAAVDVFYVLGVDGERIEEPERIEEVRRAILDRIL